MQNSRPSLPVGFWLASLGLVGCVGNFGVSGSEAGAPVAPAPAPGSSGGGPSGSGGATMTSSACHVGPERISRLTPQEYESSLHVLLSNDALEPVLDADQQPIATLDAVRKWYNAADAAGPTSAAWLSAFGSCDPADDAACAVELYESFAERAFRHPSTC